MKRFLTFEKRMAGTTGNVVLIRVFSVLVAILVTALYLLTTGRTLEDVGDIMRSMFVRTLFTLDGLMDTMLKAIPLIITAIGISFAFRMKLWNVGGEGQIAMGAFAAAGIGLLFPNLPGFLLIPLMIVASMVAGMLWAAVAAVPRAMLGVNETITTLMLNYVALKWVQYLVNGPWRDPASKGFPITKPIPTTSEFWTIPGIDIHMGLVLAVLVMVLYFVLLNRSRWGYEIRVVGESARAAEYAGIKVKRNVIAVLMLSGAIAGLAGMSELSGLTHRLETNISGNYGYTAIIIAWLARLNPWGIAAMSIFMGALLVGGKYAQTAGISDAISVMIQGIVLFFVLGFDLLSQYRIRFHFGKEVVKE